MSRRLLYLIGLTLISCTVSATIAGSALSKAQIAKIHTCVELKSSINAFGLGQPQCVWKKKILSVRFIGGDPVVIQKIEAVAAEWTQYSGETFDFDSSKPLTGPADIRVSFTDTGSWSYVGTCQSGVQPTDATMNYGWLTPTTDDAEYRRVVLHEFGHALGLLHEHQNPSAGIQWNIPAVYAYYQQTQGWDKSMVDDNIFKKYSATETMHTSYDPESIMEYPIPKELTLNGFEVGWNNQLSPGDIEIIRELYYQSAPTP